MGVICRIRLVPSLCLGFALALPLLVAGCDSGNEANMGETKGTAAADAPKSQKEFYEQQQAISKENASKHAGAKGARAR